MKCIVIYFSQTGNTEKVAKAIQKGVLHENTASRYKSRLSARLNALK